MNTRLAPALPSLPGLGSRPWPAPVLLLCFVVLWAASLRLLLKEARNGWNVAESWNLLYQAGTIAFNYQEFGFVRRGLAGSLIHASGLSQLAGTVVFHVLSAAAVAALGCWLLWRVAQPARVQAVQAGVLGVLMLFWAEDAGRTDIAIAALLALATLAFRARRMVLAALVLVVALAVHENGFIFGLPLMLALLLALDGDTRRAHRGALLAAALLVGAVGVGYAFFDHLPRAVNAEMAATIRSRLPAHELVDWAIYFAVSGMRGVTASICQNLEVNPNYGLHIASAFTVVAVAGACLAGRDRRTWALMAVAALPPLLFLIAVANDMARWTALACFNAWLVAVQRPAAAPAPGRPWALRAGLVVVLLLLSHPKKPLWVMVPIYSPSPLIEALSIRLGGPKTPHIGTVLSHCDPAWREVLSQRRRP